MNNLRELLTEIINRRNFLKGMAAAATKAAVPATTVSTPPPPFSPDHIDGALTALHTKWNYLHGRMDLLHNEPEMHGVFHPEVQKMWDHFLKTPREGVDYIGWRKADFWHAYHAPENAHLKELNRSFAAELGKAAPGFIQKHGIKTSGGLLNPDIARHMPAETSKALLDNMPHPEFDSWMDYHNNNPSTWPNSTITEPSHLGRQVQLRQQALVDSDWYDKQHRQPQREYEQRMQKQMNDSESKKSVSFGRVKAAVTPSGINYQVRKRR